MDGMGTISLEEIKVSTIISKKQFEIKMKSDEIYFGSFDASSQGGTVFIVTLEEKKLVTISDIVEIYTIKSNYWLRISGDYSLGFNYVKYSNIRNLVYTENLKYRKKKADFEMAWDENKSYQEDTLGTRTVDVSIAWQRLLKNGWSIQLSVEFGQNSE